MASRTGFFVALMREADLLPNIVTYSAAISACEMSEKLQQAIGLLSAMQEAHAMPDVITYAASISACWWRSWPRGCRTFIGPGASC